MLDALQEIGCGTIAGGIGKFVDYPFDTIKTRLQDSNSVYKGTVDCIMKTAKNEGFWGFYSGIASPVFGAAFENAAAFVLYGRTSAFMMDTFYSDLQQKQQQQQSTSPAVIPIDKPLTVVSVAGAVSGFGTGTVLTPVELIKARVQVNPKKYPDVPTAFKKTLSEEGAGAMFKGLQATLLREVPGNACWFLFYELTLRNFFTPVGKSRDDAPWYAFPLSGGVGGIFYWSAFYPADTVKTRMQTDDRFAKLGFSRTMSEMYKTGGTKVLYSGFVITLWRAFPANATIFGIYEATNKFANSFKSSSTK